MAKMSISPPDKAMKWHLLAARHIEGCRREADPRVTAMRLSIEPGWRGGKSVNSIRAIFTHIHPVPLLPWQRLLLGMMICQSHHSRRRPLPGRCCRLNT
ncbi:hypothetical protein TcWFU_003261 [Taenia crassiceps]|uniref:Uncharacterized protein n=1 Tax=Taenia crassiceps TaxID=6207 RepID=A0ABR4Q3C3_9CEST